MQITPVCQKRASDSLDLYLYMVVNHLIWLWEWNSSALDWTKPKSFHCLKNSYLIFLIHSQESIFCEYSQNLFSWNMIQIRFLITLLLWKLLGLSTSKMISLLYFFWWHCLILFFLDCLFSHAWVIAFMSLHHLVPVTARRGHQILWRSICRQLWTTWGGCWEPNPGPLWE